MKLEITITPYPVSYTHLDVYKRQVSSRPIKVVWSASKKTNMAEDYHTY